MSSTDKPGDSCKACYCATAAAVNACRYYWAGDCFKSSTKSLNIESDEQRSK